MVRSDTSHLTYSDTNSSSGSIIPSSKRLLFLQCCSSAARSALPLEAIVYHTGELGRVCVTACAASFFSGTHTLLLSPLLHCVPFPACDSFMGAPWPPQEAWGCAEMLLPLLPESLAGLVTTALPQSQSAGLKVGEKFTQGSWILE